MDLTVVPWGIATGLAVSAPLGPINFMCIRQTLRHGFWGGVFTGLGSVLGDGIFATAAALGIKALARFIAAYETWLLLAGGLFLVGIGTLAFFGRVDEGELDASANGRQSLVIVASTLALTLTNPFTFTGFVAIFGAFATHVTRAQDPVVIGLLVLSVMLGSTLWWILLSRLVAGLRERLDVRWAVRINHATGVAIVCFGLFVLGRLALRLIG